MEIDSGEKFSFAGPCNLGEGTTTAQQQRDDPCGVLAALETRTKDPVIVIPYSAPISLPPLNSNLSLAAYFTGIMSFDL